MGSRLSAPGPQEKRFAAYIEGLANAAGHEDRHTPLKNYCKGLLLPGERKSIEPMAARLDPADGGLAVRFGQGAFFYLPVEVLPDRL